MPRILPFERYAAEYDEWFEEHRAVYESEVRALRALLPSDMASIVSEESIEVGVGTGRFASPLGIPLGIEPSPTMAARSKARGIAVIRGIAEALPFTKSCFKFVLMVTTMCFLDDVSLAFREVFRVLKPRGWFILAFIDRDSPLGRIYERKKYDSPFYRIARFYSTDEVTDLLKFAGFNEHEFEFVQTVFDTDLAEAEDWKPGYGEGAFVAIRVVK